MKKKDTPILHDILLGLNTRSAKKERYPTTLIVDSVLAKNLKKELPFADTCLDWIEPTPTGTKFLGMDLVILDCETFMPDHDGVWMFADDVFKHVEHFTESAAM